MVSYELNPEEREILEAFENGELISVPNAEHQREVARQAARNTLEMMEGQQAAFRYSSSPKSRPGSA